MPVVVAIFMPFPGAVDEVVNAFREVPPLVHAEEGCQLYALHANERQDQPERSTGTREWISSSDAEQLDSTSTSRYRAEPVSPVFTVREA